MRDIATLKERVDFAERHLKTTETARNRESVALMDMWRKIRERFNHQEGEIARYRAEVETLTENNESLSAMVDDLIAIIDGNIERGRDETVPKIATLAEDLLASEPSPEDLSRFAEDAAEAPPTSHGPDTEATAPAGGLERDPDDALDADLDMLSSDTAEDEDEDDLSDHDVSEESLSPGIRSLIQRVEESGGISPDADDHDNDDDDDDDLARELEEIEMLRRELTGLRDRITAEDA